MCVCVCLGVIRKTRAQNTRTAILMIIEGQFQAFQQFSSSKLVLKSVESCFVALNYYENGSKRCLGVRQVKIGSSKRRVGVGYR
jgi:hypothetical protein